MTWGQRDVAAGALVCTSTFGKVIICQYPIGQVDTQGVWFEPFYPSCSPKNSTGSEDAVGVSYQRWWWEETECGQEEGKLNRVSPARQGGKEKTALGSSREPKDAPANRPVVREVVNLALLLLPSHPSAKGQALGRAKGGGCVQGQTPVLSSSFPYNVLVLTEGREGKSWVVLNACICRDQGYLSSLSLPTAARMVRGGSQAWQGKNVDPSVLRIPVF